MGRRLQPPWGSREQGGGWKGAFEHPDGEVHADGRRTGRPRWARSLGAECRRAPRAPPARPAAPGGPGAAVPYLEVLEEGGDARDLQAEAPGGAAGALDAPSRQRLVRPPRCLRAGAGRQADREDRQAEAEGRGRAGRRGHHGCGWRARVRGAGRGSQLRAGAALPRTSRLLQLSWKVQSFNSSPGAPGRPPSRRGLEGWGEGDRRPRHWLNGK